MNIYLISQDENSGYDTYDSAVVIAVSEEMARQISPAPYEANMEEFDWYRGSWTKPGNVKVEYIGIAKEGSSPGVVCASFNAG